MIFTLPNCGVGRSRGATQFTSCDRDLGSVGDGTSQRAMLGCTPVAEEISC